MDDERDITNREDARTALHEAAARLGVPLAEMLDPLTVPGYLRRSGLLRSAFKFFGYDHDAYDHEEE